jgi:hypothetical protein
VPLGGDNAAAQEEEGEKEEGSFLLPKTVENSPKRQNTGISTHFASVLFVIGMDFLVFGRLAPF